MGLEFSLKLNPEGRPFWSYSQNIQHKWIQFLFKSSVDFSKSLAGAWVL